TRALAASGVVAGSLARSTEAAGVPAATMVEALQAFGTAIDLERDLHDGDRFYVRYERTYTADGTAVGVGRVLWAELRTQSKGTLPLIRPRPPRAAASSSCRPPGQSTARGPPNLPLPSIVVSSASGMRADPSAQPFRGKAAPAAAAPAGKAPAAKAAAVKP